LKLIGEVLCVSSMNSVGASPDKQDVMSKYS